MPDVHLGKGAMVGSVIATKGAVIPAAVGVDISCGMMALGLSVDPRLILQRSKNIRHSIERSIPVGHEKNRVLSRNEENLIGRKNWTNLYSTQSKNRTASELLTSAKLQIGSRGGDCRKDSDIVDGIPGAYKDISEVMENKKTWSRSMLN